MSPRTRGVSRALIAWLTLGWLIVASAAAPAVAASVPNAAPVPVAVDLYRTGAFVGQTNFVQCVGASMQMMLNLIGPRVDSSAATQLRLFTLARSFSDMSTAENADGQALHVGRGASANGWALGLTKLGVGAYKVDALPTLDAAMTAAARAILDTGRPVGLLVWQGQHAWVMNGFTASGDVSANATARVTGVRVLDPLYPYDSGSWGPTPAPDSLLTMARLARTFVPYRPHGRVVALRERFVIVIPYERAIVALRNAMKI